jgi:hypothetical protein
MLLIMHYETKTHLVEVIQHFRPRGNQIRVCELHDLTLLSKGQTDVEAEGLLWERT